MKAEHMKNPRNVRGGALLNIILPLIVSLFLVIGVWQTISYFSARSNKQGEIGFAKMELSLLDQDSNDLTDQIFSRIVDQNFLPGQTIDLSEIKVSNKGTMPIYALVHLKVKITPTAGNVYNDDLYYNLDGKQVNTGELVSNTTPATYLQQSTTKNINLNYELPFELGNEYAKGAIELTLSAEAVQGYIPNKPGMESVYATYLIVDTYNDIPEANQVVYLTINIDEEATCYPVAKNSNLNTVIQNLNLTATPYNSCGWFDDNEFLEVRELTDKITEDTTLYTKMASPRNTFCFMYNNDANGEYYSVGGRLINGTTYLSSISSYDKNDKNSYNPDPTISGDIVLPCRFKNDAGLDLPVITVHKLNDTSSNDGGGFNNCRNITSVTFSSSITTLHAKIFYYKGGHTTSVSIHNKIVNCNNVPFCNSNFTQFKVSPNNPTISTILDGKIITNKQKTILYTSVSGSGKLTIPEGVTQVNYACFGDCMYVNVVLSDSVTRIREWGFYSCSKLESVTISRNSHLSLIEAHTFRRDTKLKSFYIPQTLTRIDSNAFLDCSMLKTVTVDSAKIYNALTGTDVNTCGGLLNYATTINVLKSVVDDTNNTNTFLNDTSKYTKTTTYIGGFEYYQYKKVA